MDEQISFEFEPRPTIKGFPELRWTGKRPYRSTQYYPAQLRELYGHAQDGWMNKIFWGDNLQVMSHMMKEYRGRIDLIYIDPPFDSKADYKKKIAVRGVGKAASDSSSFEEKQYTDIWTNDEYLQFMYERLTVMRELLSKHGSIYLHCDWHKSHYLRTIMDAVFGSNNFKNEIIWYYRRWNITSTSFATNHDTLLFYAKGEAPHTYNQLYIPKSEKSSAQGKSWKSIIGEDGVRRSIQTDEPTKGVPMPDVWEISMINPVAKERTSIGYPTQKPEALIERIVTASSNPGDLVFDCFMGSGTTQAVAMKLGRRFIGAVQTTTKRLISIAADLKSSQKSRGYDFQEPALSIAASPFAPYLSSSKETPHDGQESAEEIKVLSQEDIKYTGFEVYNVNNYDFFRNPIEARDLLIAALEIQPFPQSNLWDGELDGRMVKIMPVNRIATKADLKELLANLPYKTYEKRKEENASQPVERITLVCMGHEPDLKAALEQELIEYKVDVEIMDILRDKASIQLKRDSEAEVVREGEKLVIRAFYPMNLMQKLSLQKEYIEDWRQLVDSVMVDWNYDGVVMQPSVTDIPSKDEWVSGIYDIPSDAGTIKVKITDLLSESLELEVS